MTLLRKGARVFDIGAHHGGSAEKFLRFGASEVVSVEPVLANFLKLHEYASKDIRIHPVHAAITRTAGFVDVYPCNEQDGLATMYPKVWAGMYTDKTFGRGERVPAVTVRNLMEAFGVPQFVKIDVEGHEEAVVAGLCEAIMMDPQDFQHRPRVAFEFHGTHMDKALRCLAMLYDQGYRYAHYVVEDVDLNTTPHRSINEVRSELWEKLPGWGNITVR